MSHRAQEKFIRFKISTKTGDASCYGVYGKLYNGSSVKLLEKYLIDKLDTRPLSQEEWMSDEMRALLQSVHKHAGKDFKMNLSLFLHHVSTLRKTDRAGQPIDARLSECEVAALLKLSDATMPYDLGDEEYIKVRNLLGSKGYDVAAMKDDLISKFNLTYNPVFQSIAVHSNDIRAIRSTGAKDDVEFIRQIGARNIAIARRSGIAYYYVTKASNFYFENDQPTEICPVLSGKISAWVYSFSYACKKLYNVLRYADTRDEEMDLSEFNATCRTPTGFGGGRATDVRLSKQLATALCTMSKVYCTKQTDYEKFTLTSNVVHLNMDQIILLSKFDEGDHVQMFINCSKLCESLVEVKDGLFYSTIMHDLKFERAVERREKETYQKLFEKVHVSKSTKSGTFNLHFKIV
jgi:hypothetical protein